jgi:hypothetical protein
MSAHGGFLSPNWRNALPENRYRKPRMRSHEISRVIPNSLIPAIARGPEPLFLS